MVTSYGQAEGKAGVQLKGQRIVRLIRDIDAIINTLNASFLTYIRDES